MVADFRQFYGVDLPLLAPDEVPDLPRWALLWTELPRESRTARRLDPALEWGAAEYLMRNIEYYAHALWWAKTEDARHERNKPRPVEAPGEAATAAAKAARAIARKDDVARRLGIDPEAVR